MKTIVIYGSQYGSALRYARHLAEMLDVPAQSYEDVTDLSRYEQIIYLGALYAGGVMGLKRMVKYIPPTARLLLVTVGLADVTDADNTANIRRSVEKQLSPNLLARTELFHLRGGIDYARLNFPHKTMMKLLYQKAIRTPAEQRTADTRAMIETYGQTVDFVDYAALAPIVEKAKTL